MELAIRTNDHEKLVKRLEGYKYELDVNDMVQNMRNITSTIAMVSILMYTFIIMVTAIIIFNIINTLLTEMNMRKQEFAMLRSVGMTEGGFRSMIWFESIFYTLKALIPAIPISIFIQYMLMKTFGSSRWEIDWPIYLIVSGVVFAIISISKFCAFRNANKESIIETLKTDTI
ncbi:MAG: ABC transporter permease [Clostridiales bacterium]|nr:ABC transporter permease [Clostridiales bacterium]